MRAKTILNQKHLELTINRLCYQLIENHNDFENSVIIGMQPRGVHLSKIIHAKLQEITGNQEIQIGALDASFYRDDFRRRDTPIEISGTTIDFLIENKNVILVDDVLYTGRMVRAALDAMMDFGRPSSVEYLVLVERRFSRQLPVKADYVGRTIDSVVSERVDVQWKGNEGKVILTNID
ncbi:bifunctional pyr operon transcriptional regulator/uracil phosphoribosyltransferase PyrR [bacterium SCSIO 12643]|nr:bifunctional pyr operon transcriptional regulator/uracil phosphoribosyltransferase PyrR [bacterium SCSIO 12643]